MKNDFPSTIFALSPLMKTRESHYSPPPPPISKEIVKAYRLDEDDVDSQMIRTCNRKMQFFYVR